MLEPMQYALGGLSGALVGFVLGLVGGGGSILAVPLLLYLVGIAIRTRLSAPALWRSRSTRSPVSGTMPMPGR